MRKPILGNMVVARWMVALIVLIAVAVGVSKKAGPAKNAAGTDPSGGRNFEVAATSSVPSSSTQAATPTERARMRADFAALPLAFEANQGQTDARVKYMARGQGYQLFLTANEAVFALHSAASGRDTSAKSSPLASRAGRTSHPTTTDLSQVDAQASGAIRMQFVGANADAEVAAGNSLPGMINYYFGNDPAKWQQGVKQYGSVTYRQVYPGVDVAYHGQQRQLEFDFIVAPGANPRPITASFAGASKIATDGSGNLLLSSTAGDVLLHRPVAYQEKNGSRERVESRFVLEAKNRVRFELGNYDRSRELVIDPSVSYATYLGGSAEDDGYAIAVDSTGAVYVTGQTASSDFPTVSPEQGSNAGGFDVFVTKFAPGGGSLDFSTYIGGSGNDSGNAIAVNSSGVYVAGGTSSGNTGTTAFPTTHSALQTSYGGGSLDGFVLELSSSGGTLVYSTYLGGTGTDFAEGIALDSSGNAYIVGSTGSSNFPISPKPGALQSSLNGASNGFVTELNSSGTAVLYSTFLGGGTGDFASAVALDSSDNAYVTGITYSPNFPVTSSAYQKTCGTASNCNGGLSDAFVSVVEPGGTAFVYSTFLGGSNQDQGLAIAVDSSQDAYVTGLTLSSDFPTTSSVAQQNFGGGTQDAFVAALNSTGSALVYSTYLGGTGNDAASSIAVDGNKNAYVTGQTSSSSKFPLVNPTQSMIGGGNDAFVTEVNSSGSSFVFSTYLGGSQNEDSTTNGSNLSPVGGIAVDSAGANIYVTGNTFSNDFPHVNAEQGTIGGGNTTTSPDAFVAQYSTGSSSGPFTVTNGTLTPASGGPGVSATATITVTSVGSFNASVALQCSVSPSVNNGPTCTITSPVTPSAGGSATATLNVATTSGTLALDRPSPISHRASSLLYAMLLPGIGLALLGTGISSKSSRRKKLFGFLMLGLLAAGILLMPACSSSSGGGGGSGSGTPQNTYTITVTGTSGSSTVTGSPALTLTVN